MGDNLICFKILNSLVFTRECSIEVVDNIVNTIIVSLSIPIAKSIDTLNIFYKSHSREITRTIKSHFVNSI